MASRLKIPILLCTFLGLFRYGLVQAQNSPADKEVLSMLKSFYTGYVLTWNNFPTQQEKLDSILKIYCDPNLLSKIRRLTKSGELDYDPFLKAQDVDTASLKTFSYRKDPKKADTYTFSYVANGGNFKPVIHLIVNRRNGTLKIREVW